MEKSDYFNIGRNYLLSFENITESMIDAHLNAWKQQTLTSLPEVFKGILNHVKNRRGMAASIGCLERIEHILFDYDHVKVMENFSDWKEIFKAIEEDDYTPPGKMDIRIGKNLWVVYCKAIYSTCEFLTLFKSFDDFTTFIESFWTSEFTKLSLPLLLSEKIYGLGFSLACDFIKENISPEFLKPDTHIREIAKGLEITSSNDDFIVYRDVEEYCKGIDKLPYEVDKLFWLIGSGDFYLFNVEIKSDKNKYLNLVNTMKGQEEVAQ